MSEPTERELLNSATRLLRENEGALDELTVSRLRAARLRALDARSGRWRMVGAMAASGFALALAGLLWFQAPSELPAPPNGDTVVADLDLLTIENPDFYTDLDFYRWLASQSDAS